MLRDDLRRLWAAPRAPDPPRRVRRDWALLAAGLGVTTLEAATRPDVPWRPVAVLLTVVLCVATLWRRTRPLAAVTAAVGSGIAVQLATLVVRPSPPVGLYSSLLMLVLVYALLRWGSGRQVVLGTGLLVAAIGTSAVTDGGTLAELLAGPVVLGLPAAIGASVRFRSLSRSRELDQLRSREREQLARELHDTVAHHVSAIVILAQAGRVVATADPAAAVAALEGVEEEGARTLEAMRAMVGALRDREARAELAPQGRIADLERLARAPGGRLAVDLRLGGDLDGLPPVLDAAVYRIVQESLTNALRHAAGATGVRIRVTGEPDRVRVLVRDDGTPPGRGREGYGLAGLRERAALLGGSLDAGPAAGGGWQVEATVPRGGGERRDRPRPRR